MSGEGSQPKNVMPLTQKKRNFASNVLFDAHLFCCIFYECILTYTQIENSKISEILFTSNFDTGCNSRFRNEEKWTETKTERLRYDSEQKQKLPRFPSFWFRSIPQIENSKI